MSFSNERVLVTGASGFLGSHVVNQLLKEGYHVRAVSRPGKAAVVQDRYRSYGERFEVAAIDDVVTGDFTAALEGVTAVLHVASPLSGRGDSKTVLDGAIRGTRNVLAQAAAAGVKKLVFTSSTTALSHPGKPEKLAPEVYTDKDWNDATEEEAASSGNDFFIYKVSKGLAERAVWKLAEQHPDADFTTIIVPWLFGPFSPGFSIAKGDAAALSTNSLPYTLLLGKIPALSGEFLEFINVRDAARAHVLALRAPPATKVGPKRLLLSSGLFTWAKAVAHLRVARPALSDRLPHADADAKETSPRPAVVDTARAREVLGIDHLTDWKTTVEETVDDLVRLEKEWTATS